MQTSSPLITIGMPVYNGSEHIEGALESIQLQTYKNLEIIISDNGSNDNTLEICKNFASKDSRIKIIKNKTNLGAITNCNIVMRAAQGKYFMLMAHDDKKEKNFVQDCLLMLEKSEDAVLCHSLTSFYIQNQPQKVCTASMDSLHSTKNILHRYYATLSTAPAVAVYGLIRVSALKQTMYLRKSIATDIAFLCELSLYGNFVQVKKELFNYISRPKWNNIDDDYKFFFGDVIKPWWYSPFLFLFWDHCIRILFSKKNFFMMLGCFLVLFFFQLKLLIKKIILKFSYFLIPPKYTNMVGEFLYWKILHNPNVKILDYDMYKKRFMFSIIGWKKNL